MQRFRRFVTAYAILLLIAGTAPPALAQDANQAAPETASRVDSAERDYAAELPRLPRSSPNAALRSFRTLEGFRIELAAAEPLVASPVACAFDEFNRLYVVEMRDYSEQAEANLGRVRLLEDTDRDGRFDESHLFAEGLSWPTAVACWKGGVFVAAAPHIYYLRDCDGDGRAEEREIVFDGFARTNVQGLVNGLCWGLDHRIYGATSSSGAEVRGLRHPDQPALSLRRRDFSFDPRSMTMRPESGGGQHGHSIDAFGRRFVSANSDHLQMIAYEDRYVARNPYLVAPPANVSIAEDGPQAPVFRESPVEPWRIVRTRLRAKGIVPGIVEGGGAPAGYFTGATGATVYTGDAFGEGFRNTVFIADVGSNLVHRKVLSEQGVLATARRVDEKREFLASTDVWFRPVDMANGPDGALYVIDMSREVIEHPASLPPLIKKHLDLTSGQEQGRIYRVIPKGFERPTLVQLGELSSADLVPYLDHPNGWTRETAARLIFERQDASVAEAVRAPVASSTSPGGCVQALHSLAGLDQLRVQDLLAALADDHPRVREAAIRLSEAFAVVAGRGELPAALLSMADDPDPRVRYQLAFTLGEYDDPGTTAALAEIAKRDSHDRFVRVAVQSSLAEGANELFSALARDSSFVNQAGGVELLTSLAKQIGAQGPPTKVVAALRQSAELAGDSPDASRRLILALVESASKDARAAAGLREAADERTRQILNEMLSDSRKIAADPSKEPAQRAGAMGSLILASFEETKDLLAGQIDPAQPHAVQTAAIAALAGFEDPDVAQIVLDRFSSLSPAVRGEALEALFARPARIEALLVRLEQGELSAAVVDTSRRQRLLDHRDPRIAERAKAIFGMAANADRAEVLRRYAAAVETPGDAERGRTIFRKECANCHRLEGEGHEIGKDLKGIGARGAETILTNVLDPNREVDPAYLDFAALTSDGRTYSGIVSAETATSVTLTRAGGTSETLLRGEIESMRSSGMSIMPEGLERQIDVQGMADLIAYLKSLP
ncbi:MAG TPA: PVC-type heme-binding CxxCH protein [Pirellulaceae bacterium]|jgi:putative membrane-bound dehydrogenase-like protein|nr:PVC-type heme-binding CxxCH protein [Pirellulaceae bacterium]